MSKSNSLSKQFDKLVNAGYEAFMEEDFEAAEAKVLEALEMARKHNIEDLGVASALNTLAGVQRASGREEEAFGNCVAAFAVMDRECEPGDSHRIGMARNLARMASHLGRDGEALEWHRRAYELAGEGSLPELARAAISYSDALIEAGRAAEAVDLLVKERDELLEYLSSPPNEAAMMMAPMGEMIKEEFRDEHREPPALLLLRIQLAKARAALGQEDDSIAALPEMGTFEARTNGEDSPELGMQYQEIGVALHFLAQSTGKRAHFEKAEEYYKRSLEALEPVCDEDDDGLQQLRDNMQELQADMKEG